MPIRKSHPCSAEHAGSTWQIAFEEYDPADEGRRETILALGNGMFVTRAAALEANADEVHYPGTYRAGCYDRATSKIGDKEEENVSLVNLPNWLPLNFRIKGSDWFSLDAVQLSEYRHALDMKAGTAQRCFTFVDRNGRRTRVSEQRLMSMASPHTAAVRLEIVPLNWGGTVELVSGLDGNVINDNVKRYADYERRHLDTLDVGDKQPDSIWLLSRTRGSRIEVAQAARIRLLAGGNRSCATQRVVKDMHSVTRHAVVEVAENSPFVIEKTATLFTSRDPGVTAAQAAALDQLDKTGDFDTLLRAHQRAWDDLWHSAAIEAGHKATALTLRFHTFHLLQTVSPHTAALDAGVPARGWHGEGYRGHIFWDDLFVFPFLNLRFPRLSRALLLYRYDRLSEARAAARKAGFHGAMYPWRSAPDGWEATPHYQKNLLSGHWMEDPTRLQRHIGSAVAFNAWQYFLATGDTDFLADYGAEIILEVSRFWASVAEYCSDSGRFEIRGVIGPDEYHNSYPDSDTPGLNNNAYTNLTAVWTLCRGLEVLDHLEPEKRDALIHKLGLNQEEFDLWNRISRQMRVVFHGDGIISQFEGFDKLKPFSQDMLPEELRDERVDWALEAIGKTADAYQVTKQADTLTLFYLFSQKEIDELFNRLGYSFDCTALKRTADFYLQRTTHRSSLSRVTYAGALAQVDQEQSWQLYQQALETDLHALKGESITEGIHLGAMGGSLDILQRRYLGVSPEIPGLRVDPALPPELGSVTLKIRFRGSDLTIEATTATVLVHSNISNTGSVTIITATGQTALPPGDQIEIPARAGAVTPTSR